MPIRPENKARYPKNWKEISHRIRFVRAKGRCECEGECGDDHAMENDNYGFYIIVDHRGGFDSRCWAKHGELHHITGSKVILTAAHLNHIIEDCSDENLKGMCQRCHNKMDAPMRRAGIKKRKWQKNAVRELL